MRGRGESLHTNAHAHIQARKTVAPLPHDSHTNAMGKQHTLEELVHIGLNGFMAAHALHFTKCQEQQKQNLSCLINSWIPWQKSTLPTSFKSQRRSAY